MVEVGLQGLFLHVLGWALEEEGLGLEDAAGGLLPFHYDLSAIPEHVGPNALVDDGDASALVGHLKAENQVLGVPVDGIAYHQTGHSDHAIRRPLSQELFHGQIWGASTLDIAEDQPGEDDNDDGAPDEELQAPSGQQAIRRSSGGGL
jgi:hypothetical protein